MTPTYDYSGQTVIVTGGSSGIGRAVASRFGDAGATVLVADVREMPKGNDGPPTHELIERDGGRAEFVETDVADPDEIETLVEGAQEFGGVDVMVNNAGIFRGGPIVEADVETFDRVYETNVRSVFVGCQAAARDMLERGEGGAIVNTASISSEYAMVGHSMYDSTKGAVMMLTRVVATELARHDVRVNAVAPGRIETAIGSEDPGPENETNDDGELPSFDDLEISTDIPMGRWAAPEEVAGPYLFLASEDASYVTGHLLYADGGYHVV